MKQINGFPDYCITPDGQVYSKRYNRFLKASLTRQGYLRVNLRKDCKTHTRYIHRLVAEAYLPNPNGYNEVNHIDENKLNNCKDNLEWVNHQQNMTHGTLQQRRMNNYTNKNSKRVLCEETNVIYGSLHEAALAVQGDASNIQKACSGEYKTSKGYHWHYID